ncbi:MAG: hypothetical protein FJX02_14380 [Alphaproteobacteria bacterium]|nr:hypothetical protein [Alphaproteobacteria bacterium]
MRRRALIAGLLLAPVAARGQDARWQAIVSRDLRFRLEMPAPAQASVAGEVEKGHAGPRHAWSAKLDNEMFDFDHVDYQPGALAQRDSKAAARELGRGEAEKAFPPAKFKYLRDEPALLQGFDGYALDIADGDGAVVVMRTWIVRDRLYRLLATHRGDLRSASAAQRFVDSLKLAESR